MVHSDGSDQDRNNFSNSVFLNVQKHSQKVRVRKRARKPPLRRGAASSFHTGKPRQNQRRVGVSAEEGVCPQRRGCVCRGGGVATAEGVRPQRRGCGQHPVCVMRSLTHLPVSVADGLCQRAPSLSVFHLHWCIVGQQQVGTLCREHGRGCRLKDNRNEDASKASQTSEGLTRPRSSPLNCRLGSSS